MQTLPEKLYGLYHLYKEGIKHWQDRGFSPEEAFWIQFAEICSPMVWDNNAPTEVKLSEVLRLYLSIYCEQVNSHMKAYEELAFLELLKERYEKVNLIIFQSHPDNYGLATLELGRIILGEKANVIRQTEVGLSVASALNAIADTRIPLKLVRDI